MSRIRTLALSAVAPLALLALAGPAMAGTTVFSSGGYQLPESITPVSGFGPAGTGYIVPDPSINAVGPGTIWAVPQAGGTPTQLASFAGTSFLPVGGAILPSAYGTLAGQYLAVGDGGNAYIVSSGGVANQVISNSPLGQFASAVVAPSGFGSVGGQVLISGERNGTVQALAANAHGLTTFSTINSNVASFGLGFAPAGFGAVAGDLLVTDGASGNVYAITPSGHATLFATIALPAVASPGLRQFAFAPAGYGAYGGDLFVSVSASGGGGGTIGDIAVLDSSGHTIATFLQGSSANPLDPRGLYFVNSNTLLASNGDPDIEEITASSFVGVPEPGAAAIALTAVGALALVGRSGRSASSRG